MKQHSIKHPKLNIARQIQLFFLLSVVLPISIIGTFSTFHIRKQILENYTSHLHADNIRANSILFDITTSTYTSIHSIISTDSCRNLFGISSLSQLDASAYSTLDNSLSNLYRYNAALSSIEIYTNNPYIEDGVHITRLSSFTDETWYQALPEGAWESWLLLTDTDRWNHDLHQLCLVRKIPASNNNYQSYIVVRLDHNYLRNLLEQTDYKIEACIEGSNIFYSSDLSQLNTVMEMPEDYTESWYSYNGPFLVDGTRTLTEINTFSTYMTNNKFYIKTSNTDAYREINRITYLYITIIALTILLPAAIILIFSNYFSGRINTLKHAMHQVSNGNYYILDTLHGDDELAETFDDLRLTVDSIHEKEALYYETQLKDQKLINKQQQMEFNLLASQINPHFLYNTLETIRVQALSHNNRDVASSINLLGKSMHYVLENTGTSQTTLAKELDYIKTYLAIQHLRFGDRINGTFEIAEDCDPENIRILPLLLQPIVENAILHGLEDITGPGYIIIAICIKETELIITVTDNGIGMDAETLAQVQTNLETHDAEDKQSIGLYNINQRIKLCYGSEYSLQIESKEEKGTCCTLHLPYVPV